MRRIGTFFTVLVTAVITAAVTSAFWIAAYSNGDVAEPAPKTGAVAGKETPAANIVIGPAGLAIPVVGIRSADLQDTYTQARAGGARVHDAIDIMASSGTPVIAAAPGTVEKLYFSKGGGGITAYVRSPDRNWIYYYAHLQEYAPGLKEGRQVKRGDPIGIVGFTGNANPAGPHLHFAVHHMAPQDDWHEGDAVNPYPLLAGNSRSR